MLDKGYDVKPIIELIQQESNVDKVVYAGYSQGNTIMFHALSKEIEEKFFAENMSAFIALAPCLIFNNPDFTYDEFIDGDWKLHPEFPVLMGSSFKQEETLETVCNNASSKTCSMLTGLRNLNSLHKSDIKAALDTRSYLQYAQNRIEKRF